MMSSTSPRNLCSIVSQFDGRPNDTKQRDNNRPEQSHSVNQLFVAHEQSTNLWIETYRRREIQLAHRMGPMLQRTAKPWFQERQLTITDSHAEQSGCCVPPAAISASSPRVCVCVCACSGCIHCAWQPLHLSATLTAMNTATTLQGIYTLPMTMLKTQNSGANIIGETRSRQIINRSSAQKLICFATIASYQV